jgi:hypothetical protein
MDIYQYPPPSGQYLFTLNLKKGTLKIQYFWMKGIKYFGLNKGIKYFWASGPI